MRRCKHWFGGIRKAIRPKNLHWENFDLHHYRSLDSPEAIDMFDMERHFDAGSGYVRITPGNAQEPSRFTARQQRTARKRYASLGQKLVLTRMQHVSVRYFEWYALRTFLGLKTQEIREREGRTPRKGGTGIGIGNPNDPNDFSAIAHGIKLVSDLVGFHR